MGHSDAGREHYVDTGSVVFSISLFYSTNLHCVFALNRPSELRKMHDSLSDPKYNGIKTSKNQWLAHESNEEEAEDDDSTDHKAPIHLPVTDASSSPSEVHEDHEDQEARRPLQKGIANSGVPHEPSPPSNAAGKNAAPHQDETLASSLQRTRAADKLKGKAVVRQLVRLTARLYLGLP